MESTKLTRKQRVEQMAKLNDSIAFSILEWGAEANYTLREVGTSLIKYPKEIIEGVYRNLIAVREDFRAKRRRARFEIIVFPTSN